MADPKLEFLRYVDGEESQTDFFVSLLDWAETHRVLNEVHENDHITFDESAQIIATQRDGLKRHPPENSKRRQLDWVVRDETKIVGYESKCGASIDAKQLREELQKLEVNANGRDPCLFLWTEHVQEPDFDADAYWKSWSEVGQTIIGMDEPSIPVKMMANMFREQGYEGFTGFSEFDRTEEWFVKHQNEAVDLALDAGKYANGIRLYDRGEKHIDHHNRTNKNIYHIKKKDHRGISPPYYIFSYHPSGYRDQPTDYNISSKGWYIALVIPALHNRILIELNTYPSKDERARELFRENATALADIIADNQMHVHSSKNSLVRPEKPEMNVNYDEIVEILEQRAGEDSWKRLRFGWEIDTDQAAEQIVREIANKMENLHRIFFDGVERRESFIEN